MTCEIIATGSTGNAVLLDGTVLVDCGVPYRQLEPFMLRLQLVLLTHAHSDHFRTSTVRRLASERPMLRWACCPWMVQRLVDAGVRKRQIDVIAAGAAKRYSVRISRVQPVPVPHDVPNCGWRLDIGGEQAFYATDCGSLDDISLPGLDLYLIEANHTTEDIQQRAQEKLARGEYAYEIRAAANHLSLEQATEWICKNAGPQSRYIFLHQHHEQNQNQNQTEEEEIA